MKLMWSFRTKNFVVEWRIDKDTLYTQHMDPEYAKELKRNLASGKWKCFSSDIRVVYTPTKTVLGTAYLDGSIYADPAEFRDHIGSNGRWGSYFTGMVRDAIREARKSLLVEQTKAEDAARHARKAADAICSVTLRKTE